jgi:hypothetical protein
VGAFERSESLSSPRGFTISLQIALARHIIALQVPGQMLPRIADEYEAA